MKSYKSTFGIIALLTMPNIGNAATIGGESYNNNMEVGSTTVVAGPHTGTGPGVGVSTIALSLADKVSFTSLQTLGSTTTLSSGPISKLTTLTPAGSPHPIGYFNFAQVSGQDVFFGEWTSNNNVATGNHTVYYIGRDGDTSLTKTGTVKYDMRAISNYQSQGLMIGEFTADFTTKKMTGNLYTPTFSYAINIGTANINTDGSITSGTSGATKAFAYVSGYMVAYDGVVNGRFFNNQESLAGFIKFPTTLRQYDTAFGGVVK
ncbi:hypothetical protein HW090_09225 [Pseudomonas sp. ABC1]|uniref:Slam-dependent surface lipoprotein n=1 Tax=Pseudomonas sp. ABC1 TaxID=2748080 RepID=UPI0015C40B15|nr:Slam-dependent surface lipoprotein [Pseudomonas sp. ABC1]QLF93366.1 hypothetical protein HW090_09225 [Pseudomonas sp. ABC1]